jgi:chloramphenicol-sensitive protein RarD
VTVSGSPRGTRAGAVYALLAYGTWGLVAAYWKLFGAVPATEIVAHRVVWSLLVVAGLITVARRWPDVARAARDRKTLRLLACTTALISTNWGLFIWAVTSGHILQSSLGYFINPIVNVLLGVVALGERLRRAQWVAVALAGTGVGVLAIATGVVPWVSLMLAATFGLYGLLRKTATVESLVGLFVETALLAPVAAGYLALREAHGVGALGRGSVPYDALLVASGLVTALPLVWFAAAARRLPLSVLGFFQYVSPTLQFVLAVAVYKERFTPAHVATFGCIWAAVALFSFDAQRAWRSAHPRA